MTIKLSTDVDYDVSEIIDIMDNDEKLDMYKTLAAELGNAPYKENFDVAKFFASKSAYDQKKILCNALNVGSYCDELALRKALEKIIKA